MANDVAVETTRKTKQKVSEREVLGADRNPQEEYIGAAGFSYKTLVDDYNLVVMWEELPEDVVYGLAAFGGLTMAGNVTNTVRNGENKSGATTEKEALIAWYENLKAGDWSKPTGELEAGLTLLAEAYVRARAEQGDTVDFEATLTKLKAADKDKRKAVRSDPQVAKAVASIQLERKAAKAKESNAPIVSL